MSAVKVLRHLYVSAVFVNKALKSTQSKAHNATRLLTVFPTKWWTKRSINRLPQKKPTLLLCWQTQSSSAQTEDSVTLINDLILSQEDKPRIHKTVQTKLHNNIHRSSGVVSKEGSPAKIFQKAMHTDYACIHSTSRDVDETIHLGSRIICQKVK